jgi:hypothetical protein
MRQHSYSLIRHGLRIGERRYDVDDTEDDKDSDASDDDSDVSDDEEEEVGARVLASRK